jgi:hypothetical protein
MNIQPHQMPPVAVMLDDLLALGLRKNDVARLSGVNANTIRRLSHRPFELIVARIAKLHRRDCGRKTPFAGNH